MTETHVLFKADGVEREEVDVDKEVVPLITLLFMDKFFFLLFSSPGLELGIVSVRHFAP